VALGQYVPAMVDQAAFNALMSALDYPMFIVTVGDGESRAGCLIGFAGQVSIHPPRFVAGLSDKNHTYRVAAAGAEHLAVHLVPSRAIELAELFGGQTGDEVDKFAQCDWHDGPRGLPILDDCPSWFVGRVLDRIVFGDHVGFLLEPEVVDHDASIEQLDFHRARGINPGHRP
jgi:flavin reductase (DIM6/NTAB) family NADH-FMN oxidoreductase RutF